MTDPNGIASIAYFISDHGFGHAARAAAVMAAMQRKSPRVRFELFTTSPRQIFADSLQSDFGYHAVQADVGMVQHSPLKADIEATCRKLAAWIPFDAARVDPLVQTLIARGCRLVICDISPMGIAVAKAARLPCVLIESFTWDWIYAPYLGQAPALAPYVDFLKEIFAQADLRIQTEPLCNPIYGSLSVPPISRLPRTPPDKIRAGLNIPVGRKMVLVSMGGIPDRFEFMRHLPAALDAVVVISGMDGMTQTHPDIIGLPAHATFFHPDLLQAADLLIGKAGYSTIAEAYHCGTPFGFIARTESPESPALERFIHANLPSSQISAEVYQSGRWLRLLPELLALPRGEPAAPNGAATVADLLCTRYC